MYRRIVGGRFSRCGFRFCPLSAGVSAQDVISGASGVYSLTIFSGESGGSALSVSYGLATLLGTIHISSNVSPQQALTSCRPGVFSFLVSSLDSMGTIPVVHLRLRFLWFFRPRLQALFLVH